MAGQFFLGLGQTIAGGIATAATLGLNDDVNQWTADGARKVGQNAEKAWGADGEVTKFVEGLPGLGYVASAGHGIAAAVTGNERDLQRARRACASANKAGLVTAGAVGGALVGGPAGAVAGAAAGNAAGQCAEKGMNHTNDKEFQTDGGTFHDFNAGNFVGEVALTGAMSVVGSGTSQLGKAAARGVVGDSLKKAGGGGVKRYVAKRVVENAVKKPANKLAKDQLKGAFY